MSYTDQKPNLVLRDQLVEVKRKFASDVQYYLDPRNWRTMFSRLTEFTGRSDEGSKDAEPGAAADGGGMIRFRRL